MFDTELAFFIANQEDLVRRYRGTVLVIRGKEVVGAFKTPIEAYLAAAEQFPEGSYMLQPCQPGVGAYTVTLSPAMSRTNCTGQLDKLSVGYNRTTGRTTPHLRACPVSDIPEEFGNISRVVDLVGPVCVDPVDGGRLFEEIKAFLGTGEYVDVDFAGVTTLTSSFLNQGLGRLFEDLAPEEVDRRVRCHGLDAADTALAGLVRKNAIRFYGAAREDNG